MQYLCSRTQSLNTLSSVYSLSSTLLIFSSTVHCETPGCLHWTSREVQQRPDRFLWTVHYKYMCSWMGGAIQILAYACNATQCMRLDGRESNLAYTCSVTLQGQASSVAETERTTDKVSSSDAVRLCKRMEPTSHATSVLEYHSHAAKWTEVWEHICELRGHACMQ